MKKVLEHLLLHCSIFFKIQALWLRQETIWDQTSQPFRIVWQLYNSSKIYMWVTSYFQSLWKYYSVVQGSRIPLIKVHLTLSNEILFMNPKCELPTLIRNMTLHIAITDKIVLFLAKFEEDKIRSIYSTYPRNYHQKINVYGLKKPLTRAAAYAEQPIEIQTMISINLVKTSMGKSRRTQIDKLKQYLNQVQAKKSSRGCKWFFDNDKIF